MKHQLTADQRPLGDLFITPLRAIRELARAVRPAGFTALWDPAASGAARYTVGEELGRAWGLPAGLSDLHPRRPDIVAQDYLTAERPEVDGPLVTATNPPYQIVDLWLGHWRETALPGDLGIFLLPFDTIPVKADRSQDILRAWVQPRWRLSFLLTEEDARATGRPGKAVDGLVAQSTTGKSHGWAVFQAGWTGGASLVIPGVHETQVLGAAVQRT